jgi:hypothetical protein
MRPDDEIDRAFCRGVDAGFFAGVFVGVFSCVVAVLIIWYFRQ